MVTEEVVSRGDMQQVDIPFLFAYVADWMIRMLTWFRPTESIQPGRPHDEASLAHAGLTASTASHHGWAWRMALPPCAARHLGFSPCPEYLAEQTPRAPMVIRTRLVELSSLEAVAYRQKLRGGQSGVVILRPDTAQPGLALLNHQSGQPDPAANTPAALYPLEAFQEALELTSGLPYSSRGPVRSPAAVPGAPAVAAVEAPAAPELAEEPSGADLATVNSADYQAIVKAYTNKKGEISYDLLNKALIQAARSNPYVAEMIGRGASEAEIRDHVVKANVEAVTGNRAISQAEVNAIVELLDAVSPRAVLRELNEELRRMLAERR